MDMLDITHTTMTLKTCLLCAKENPLAMMNSNFVQMQDGPSLFLKTLLHSNDDLSLTRKPWEME